MRIEHFAFDGPEGHPIDTRFDLVDGLNLVDARQVGGGLPVADLVGHVLYGARLYTADTPIYDQPGHVDIQSRMGRYRLQRHSERAHRGAYTEPRLTVAALEGQPVRTDTNRDLLSGMSPEVASRLFVLNSTSDSQLEWLLSESLAVELHRLDSKRGPETASHTTAASSEQLFARRDALSHKVEQLLADKRRTSEALETAIRELKADQAAATQQLHDDRRSLDSTQAKLAELESRLRYRELSDFVGRATDEAHRDEQQTSLTGLDEEIAKWRRSLSELKARESHLRTQLAQLHPDEASPLLPLADQRACVSIAQRLVADLDSEVARYARPGDSTACLCNHTHARLHPLVDTLGQQVAKLAQLVEQYEQAIELQQLQTEVRHLQRSQAEMQATVEHLLDCRQSRLRTSRVRDERTASDSTPAENQKLHAELQHRCGELSTRVAEGQRRVAELTAQGERLHRERTELLNDSALATLRQQLEELNRQLDANPATVAPRDRSVAPWRASDVLAKLTDGRLREVRLNQDGRQATAVTQDGVAIRHSELNCVDRRLLTLSLQLAAVAGAAQWGLDLPLVVADPFAELPAAQSAILALLLHDWARAGHQLLVVTGSPTAIERLRAVGQPVLSSTRAHTSAPSQPIAKPVESQYALQLSDPVGRFRVFADDTDEVFGSIGIVTISDLLDADAEDISHSLDRTGVSTPIVDLWQRHVAMLVYVPHLSLADVQLITGAGVDNLQQLADADAEKLHRAIHDYLQSPQGVRHRSLRTGLEPNRVASWIADAAGQRGQWRSSPYATRTARAAGATHTTNGKRRKRCADANAKRPAERKKTTRPLRFRLSRTSPVVDAPSIGPKTAKRLSKVGLKTVDDLLAADAAETAEQLDVNHITAEKIVAWQHQSQLMCRVPELLARDTQVLVECGFTTPEGIATADAADLLEFAKSYTATPAGTRALRGADAPDLERVKKWIYWASHRREMEAA